MTDFNNMPPYLDSRLNQLQDRFEEHINKLETKIDKFIETQINMRVQLEQIKQVHRNERDIAKNSKDIEEIKQMVYKWSGGIMVLSTSIGLIFKYIL